MSKFQKGDVVQLKSGGPTMTIDFCEGEESDHVHWTWKGSSKLSWNAYRCVWFDGVELKSEDLREHLIVAVDENAGKVS